MRFHGFDPAEALVEVEPTARTGTFSTAAIERAIAEHGPRWRRSCWPGVQYRTGQAFDLAEIADSAVPPARPWLRPRARGRQPAAAPHDSGADFAVWCHHKYNELRPGAVAGCFVHERHARTDRPLRWLVGQRPAVRFRWARSSIPPAPTVGGCRTADPRRRAAARVAGAVRPRDPARARASQTLTGYLEALIDAGIARTVLQVVTPRDPAQRGCQLSLRVVGGRERKGARCSNTSARAACSATGANRT